MNGLPQRRMEVDTLSGKILIVDDDLMVLKTYDHILSRWGHQVQTAQTAEEALRLQEAREYDLVLLDLILPGMSGMDYLRVFRKKNTQPDIIVMTGFATFETAVEAARLGVYSYLAKPCKVEELQVKIDQALAVRKDPLIAFMRANSGKIGSREEVAHRFGVSPGTVLNRVKRATRQSFSEFLQRCRIEEAMRLLEQTEVNISQIASRVGFSTPQAFARTFRRLTSHSPRQYRRSSRLSRTLAG